MANQLPISLHGGEKGSARTQFAALCWRVRRGKVQILLITSRRRKRWIVPKGWPMDGKTPADCALTESWEEAGVVGTASDDCIGVYSYARMREGEEDVPCLAMLYPVKVKTLKTKFPERKYRRRKWVSRKKAAKLVNERELSKLINSFSPPKSALKPVDKSAEKHARPA
ncbi:NUDIX hydrolase [Sulfitobacter guttiformis]|uniref:8-oxo-dGTP pyrophosphatase MutT (NUDIX family) n=1 Tax=Sulfitobacter guttiformis TaxID=74349 RepID=A0A420DP13_9RHOB|nr:NUDIX hydrolase [Sulfitobacter guttiformis]KIN73358.1 NUDIX domain protein [Sulfitobacter guttiformis KCTC 32187]RKE96024.1 8-oxo-dGTP pyrophosphatase MutT (NUDIX family) [Sulfitobacter guttiformis]